MEGEGMIPARAVEAAAKGSATQAWGDWEFVPNSLRRLFLRDARIALEAAAPHMQRTITTAEELDALPFEAVIRDAEGHVLERWGHEPSNVWATMMVTAFIPRGDIALPAIVLHELTP